MPVTASASINYHSKIISLNSGISQATGIKLSNSFLYYQRQKATKKSEFVLLAVHLSADLKNQKVLQNTPNDHTHIAEVTSHTSK